MYVVVLLSIDICFWAITMTVQLVTTNYILSMSIDVPGYIHTHGVANI